MIFAVTRVFTFELLDLIVVSFDQAIVFLKIIIIIIITTIITTTTTIIIIIIIIIIGCLGGGVDKTIREVRRIFENDELAKQIVGTMQKTVLMDSETTLRKIFSGLIQLEES